MEKYRLGPTPRTMEEKMLAKSKEVPAALSQLILKIASIALGLLAIGATWIMALCKPGTIHFKVTVSIIATTGFRPQRITITVKMMNGDHALIIAPVESLLFTCKVGAFSFSKRQIVEGFQTRRNRANEMIAAKEDRMSGSSGPR